MTPDPEIWFQKRLGSAAWYKVAHGDQRAPHAHYVKTCEQCGQEELMESKQQFCSRDCAAWFMSRPRIKVPSYRTAHDRVRKSRGKASESCCVDCAERADDWSYDGLDPDELIGESGKAAAGMRYSLKPEHYAPRCKPCHADYDVTHGNRSQPGEGNARSKLTAAQVRGIRASEGVSQRELSEHFGVSQTLISAIRLGKKWTEM